MEDTKRQLIAKIYAEPAFELAVEDGTEQRLLDEILAVNKIFAANADFASIFANIAVPSAAKVDLIRRVLAEKISPLALNLLISIVKRDRTGFLPDIISVLQMLLDRRNNIKIVYVVFAQQPSQTRLEEFRQNLRNQIGADVKLNIGVDASLIGGVILRMDDRVIDGSVKNMLQKAAAKIAAA